MEFFHVAPVRLVADWDVLRLFEIEPGHLSVEEQHQLIEKISPLFEEREMALQFRQDLQWQLQVPPEHLQVQTTPLHRVVGASLHDYMPRGEDQRLWRQLLNEVQMTLHPPPLGDSPRVESSHCNGVWIWREPSRVERVVEWGRSLLQSR